MFKKTCKHCGKKFDADAPNTAYCSLACRRMRIVQAKRAVRRKMNGEDIARIQKMYYDREKAGERHAKKTNGFEAVMGLSRDTLDYISSIFPKFDAIDDKARYMK